MSRFYLIGLFVTPAVYGIMYILTCMVHAAFRMVVSSPNNRVQLKTVNGVTMSICFSCFG